MNCWLVPTGMLVATGSTAIEIKFDDPTVKVATPETLPDTAVTLTMPCPVAVTRPEEFTEPDICGTTYHVTEFVRFCVLPSLYVPVAWYCWSVPSATEAVAGATDSETRAGTPTAIVAELLCEPKLA